MTQNEQHGQQAPADEVPENKTDGPDETDKTEGGDSRRDTQTLPSFKPAKPRTRGTADTPGKGRRRGHRHWKGIAVTVLAVCAIVAMLFANGNIPHTSRASVMSACRSAAAEATTARDMAQLASKEAKAYRDDDTHEMSAEDLQTMVTLLDDMDKEPDIPTCSITMVDETLSANGSDSGKLRDAYVEISRQLLLLTATDTGQSSTSQDQESGSGSGTDGTESTLVPQWSTQPTPTPTASASPSASASATPTASASPSPSVSASSGQTASPSATAESTPSPSASASQSGRTGTAQ